MPSAKSSVNGSDRVFFEKNGFLQQAEGISIGDRALMVAVKNIARRLGNDISEANPILDSRLPDGSSRCCRYSSLQLGEV